MINVSYLNILTPLKAFVNCCKLNRSSIANVPLVEFNHKLNKDVPCTN